MRQLSFKRHRFPFTRGALYSLLQNPIYIGRIRHKDRTHEGQHEGIIGKALWDRVQAQLDANRIERSTRSNAKAPSLLAGLLEDAQGVRFCPRHANRQGRRHRYYVAPDTTLPAHEIETLVTAEITLLLTDQPAMAALLPTANLSAFEANLVRAGTLADELKTQPCPGVLTRLLRKIVIGVARIELHIDVDGLRALVSDHEAGGTDNRHSDMDIHVITRAFQLKRCGHGKKIILGQVKDAESTKPDPSLIKSIARAHCWVDDLKAGLSYKDIANRYGIDQRHVARTIRLAFLAPDITEAILKGGEPHDLTTERLLKLPSLPAEWHAQRALLGLV